MKSIDFLFLEELNNREINSLILLSEEMIRRGFSARCIPGGRFYWGGYRLKYKPRVIVFNGIRGLDGLSDLFATVGKVQKAVMLRWEQIPTVGCDSEFSEYEKKSMTQTEKTFHVFVWGDNSYDRMINKLGYDEKYIHKTGAVFMDFLRPEIQSVYRSKESILREYGIPHNKKILLFISSFFVGQLSDERYERNIGLFNHTKKETLMDFENKTRDTILQWFDDLLKEKECEWIIIYREHPGFKESEAVRELVDKREGFYVISDYAAQQWVVISDKICTVTSTMISEVYFSGKELLLLRPYSVPKGLDVVLYEECSFIRTETDFLKAVHDSTEYMTVHGLEKYYDYKEYPSYKRMADELERIIQSDSADIIWNEQEFSIVKQMAFCKKIKCFPNVVRMQLEHLVKSIIIMVSSHISALRKVKKINKIMEDYEIRMKVDTNRRIMRKRIQMLVDTQVTLFHEI